MKEDQGCYREVLSKKATTRTKAQAFLDTKILKNKYLFILKTE